MAGHRFNPEKAEKLLDPKRKEVVTPEQVIEILRIQKDDKVADLGAGNGYFTIPIAKITEETVYAVDIEPKMLGYLRENAEKNDITNLSYVRSDISKTPIQNGVCDKALIGFVTHEVEDVESLLLEVKRIVKKEGALLILEWEAVSSEFGPALQERIPSQQLKKQLEKNGYTVELFIISNTVYGLLVKFL
ncbi:class I SAM-dependent methyltransferase [Ectobacillus polymachus]|uniref:class I SAM-dependent methyltransferase n=1 Tax=Ectobacillus polymachus TaxID=1508806 RepID=UPI003A87AC25